MAKKVQKGKKPAPKKAAKPAKKANASKKAAKPVKKSAKAAPKKVVKKAAPKKAIAKPVAKKKVAPKKAVAKKAVKPVKKAAKPAAKKVVPKKAAPKKVAKAVAKKAVKPVAKKAPAKPVKKVPAKAVKPVQKPVAKKVMPAKAPVKPVAKAPAPKAKSIVEKAVEKGKEIVKSIANALPGSKNDNNNGKSDRGTEVEKKSLPAQKPALTKPAAAAKKEDINQGENEKVDMRKGKEEGGVKAESVKPTVVKRDPNEKTRYSDSELQEFKDLIMKKLDEAHRDYELLKDTLSHRDNNGTDDTSPTFKLLEDGSDVLSKEETAQLAARQQKFIQALENALIRIENKTYGICRATGKLISKERLRSVPHATLSIEAKKEQS